MWCEIVLYRVFRSKGGAKLLAVKVAGLKKKSAALTNIGKVCASAFGLGLSPHRFESFS